VSAELSEENQHQLWIPPGFAHGFYVLSGQADVTYKCTTVYEPELDRVVRWDDPNLGIAWPLSEGTPPLLSPKDASAPSLTVAETYP
jgi:dTDP-4-dehydrorhamnose 3,5-epimerase